MYAVVASFETWSAARAVERADGGGDVGVLGVRRVDALMASLYFESVTFPPLGATNTTGTVPLARDGNLSSSTSVADWLSVPGSVRLSLRLSPMLRSTS